MVPVSGKDDIFITQPWITTGENPDDVRRLHPLHFAFQIDRSFEIEFHRLKLTRGCAPAQVIEILSGEFHNSSRRTICDPGAHLQKRSRISRLTRNIKTPRTV